MRQFVNSIAHIIQAEVIKLNSNESSAYSEAEAMPYFMTLDHPPRTNNQQLKTNN
jgi:hypothetical protein